MTFFIFLSVLNLSFATSELPNLKCITSGFPTTSFVLESKAGTESKVELLVVNHNGAKFAPVFSGIATPNDLELIKKSGEFFEKIGNRFTILFDPNRCRFEKNKFFTCGEKNAFELNGVAIQKAYFTTSETVDRIPDFEFVRNNVRLYLQHDDKEYKLEMSYYNDDCKILSRTVKTK